MEASNCDYFSETLTNVLKHSRSFLKELSLKLSMECFMAVLSWSDIHSIHSSENETMFGQTESANITAIVVAQSVVNVKLFLRMLTFMLNWFSLPSIILRSSSAVSEILQRTTNSTFFLIRHVLFLVAGSTGARSMKCPKNRNTSF